MAIIDQWQKFEDDRWKKKKMKKNSDKLIKLSMRKALIVG